MQKTHLVSDGTSPIHDQCNLLAPIALMHPSSGFPLRKHSSSLLGLFPVSRMHRSGGKPDPPFTIGLVFPDHVDPHPMCYNRTPSLVLIPPLLLIWAAMALGGSVPCQSSSCAAHFTADQLIWAPGKQYLSQPTLSGFHRAKALHSKVV